MKLDSGAAFLSKYILWVKAASSNPVGLDVTDKNQLCVEADVKETASSH